MFQTADAFLPPWMSGVELRIESVVLPHPLPWNCVFAAVQLGLRVEAGSDPFHPHLGGRHRRWAVPRRREYQLR